MILNSQTLAALKTSFNKLFKDAFNETKTQYERIATTVPSSSASNTYGWLGTLPSLREWIGDRSIQNIKEHDYTIKNKDFETTVAVKVNDIKDDNLGMYSILIQDLGDCAKRHPDELVFGLLKQGTSLKCYDKQNFFDTDHPVSAPTARKFPFPTISPAANRRGSCFAPNAGLNRLSTRSGKTTSWSLKTTSKTRTFSIARKSSTASTAAATSVSVCGSWLFVRRPS